MRTGLFSAVTRIGIPVSDVSKAARWCADMLDAQISDYRDDHLAPMLIPDISGIDFFLMRVGETRRLRFSSADGQRAYCIFSLLAINVAPIYARLKERGVTLGPLEQGEDGPDGFWFEDLEGNQFEVSALVAAQ
jgi:hypothetical protein